MVRGLNRSEVLTLYRKYSSFPALLEIKACQQATIEPEDFNWEESLAGVVSTLFGIVWDLSGSSANGDYLGQYIKEATEWLTDTQGKQEAIALACVPGLTLKTLQEADPPDYIRYLWLGQFACQAIFGVSVENLLNPPEPKKDPNMIRSTRAKDSPPPSHPPPSPHSEEEDYQTLLKKSASSMLSQIP